MQNTVLMVLSAYTYFFFSCLQEDIFNPRAVGRWSRGFPLDMTYIFFYLVTLGWHVGLFPLCVFRSGFPNENTNRGWRACFTTTVGHCRTREVCVGVNTMSALSDVFYCNKKIIDNFVIILHLNPFVISGFAALQSHISAGRTVCCCCTTSPVRRASLMFESGWTWSR